MCGAWLVACSSSGDGAYDYASSKGAALYQDQCQVCHGETGEGGLGPTLRDTKRSQGDLANIIAMRMPANNPGQCTGECAIGARRLHQARPDDEGTALRCRAAGPAPAAPADAPRVPRDRARPVRHARADVRQADGLRFRDTCTAGACEATRATRRRSPTIRMAAAAQRARRRRLQPLATTIAAGGLALTYDAASGLWTGTFAIGEGAHQYKLVLDEQTWIVDPRAPASRATATAARTAC